MLRVDESILLFLVHRPYFLTIVVFHLSFFLVTSCQRIFDLGVILSSSGSQTLSSLRSFGTFTTSHLTR
jgi:hypothetical protein